MRFIPGQKIKEGENIIKFLKILLIITIFIILLGAIHEGSHIIMAKTMNYKAIAIIICGKQIYPKTNLKIKPEYEIKSWFKIRVIYGDHWTNLHKGMFFLSGSLMTFLFSILANILIWHYHCLMPGAFLFIDMFFYIIMHYYLGLKHWIILGGDISEPILACKLLGINEKVFIFCILLCCGFMMVNLYAYLMANMTHTRT